LDDGDLTAGNSDHDTTHHVLELKEINMAIVVTIDKQGHPFYSVYGSVLATLVFELFLSVFDEVVEIAHSGY